MWDVFGVGWFWTLERVRDVRGSGGFGAFGVHWGEADWVWAGCWDVDGLLGGGWYAGGLGEGNKKPGPGGDWAVWFEDPSLRSG